MFKFIATVLIGIILGGLLFFTYNILNKQTDFNFQGNLFFIMYACVFGLIYLTSIYFLWEKEIEIYYKNKKTVQKLITKQMINTNSIKNKQ